MATNRTLPVLLSKEDRDRLEKLANAWDVSLAEAIRRSIQNEYERFEEDRIAPRLDQLRDHQMQTLEGLLSMRSDLVEIRSRIEAVFPLIKAIERETHSKLDDIAQPTNATAIRLLAMIRTMKPEKVEEIEREMSKIIGSGV